MNEHSAKAEIRSLPDVSIPEVFQPYATVLGLCNYDGWEKLRGWELSEVWRASAGQQSHILKIGISRNAREITIYDEFLQRIEAAPKVIDYVKDQGIAIIKLQDLQAPNLEQAPNEDGYEMAAVQLSKLRQATVQAKGQGTSVNDHLRDFDRIALYESRLKRHRPVVLHHLVELYDGFPPVLTHNDYHTKNLIYTGGDVRILDWSEAYVSPHLGDLYSLISSAEGARNQIVSAYEQASGERNVHWQLTIGAICWLMERIRYFLDGGTEEIPIAKEWIPDLVNDLLMHCEMLKEWTKG
ncbi:aminoglycoside phosphotransferase family protein [Geomicrobium sp. JSM 1781026]|uniref:aminoglycoside phosphotransferase family protein n=1 Tax=Geomicrobium sp. JSM 1781026 TaxID=3344580 RepID=UPI0035C180EA